MRKNLVLLCGGMSSEHEISILSACYLLPFLKRLPYQLFIVGIDRQGVLHELTPQRLAQIKVCDAQSGPMVHLQSTPQGAILSLAHQSVCVDILFPLFHGMGGEDGSIQGWMECLHVPYIGSGILSSALAMDKEMTKKLLSWHNLPVVPFMSLSYGDPIPSYQEVSDQLKSEAFFIKPATAGSSLGVCEVKSVHDFYEEKVRHAFCYGHKILFEKKIRGKEIECALWGHEKPQVLGIGEMVIAVGHTHSYDVKYYEPDHLLVRIPPEIEEQQKEMIEYMALKTFSIFECSGLARVDFFVTAQDIWINEVNTMPGFTATSFYSQLLKKLNLPVQDFIQHLVNWAYEKFHQKQRLSYCPLNHQEKAAS